MYLVYNVSGRPNRHATPSLSRGLFLDRLLQFRLAATTCGPVVCGWAFNLCYLNCLSLDVKMPSMKGCSYGKRKVKKQRKAMLQQYRISKTYTIFIKIHYITL